MSSPDKQNNLLIIKKLSRIQLYYLILECVIGGVIILIGIFHLFGQSNLTNNQSIELFSFTGFFIFTAWRFVKVTNKLDKLRHGEKMIKNEFHRQTKHHVSKEFKFNRM